MIALLALVQDSVSVGTQYATEGISLALTGAIGIAASFVLGIAKKGLDAVGVLDNKIATLIKPLYPAVVMGLGILLPLAAKALGLLAAVPSADLVAQAPLAAVIGVVAREVAVRFLGQKA